MIHILSCILCFNQKYNVFMQNYKLLFFNIEKYNYKLLIIYNTFIGIGGYINK